jgi:hypothetical protein
MGRTAVDRLLAIISERDQSENDKVIPARNNIVANNIHVLPTSLIERASTAPPRSR